MLKIKSFLANQIFHHKNFGMACQIFLHSWLVERIHGYLDIQFPNSLTSSMFEGAKTSNPLKICAQAFWVKTQPTKIWSEVCVAWWQRQHLNGRKNPLLDRFSLVRALWCISIQVKKILLEYWENFKLLSKKKHSELKAGLPEVP